MTQNYDPVTPSFSLSWSGFMVGCPHLLFSLFSFPVLSSVVLLSLFPPSTSLSSAWSSFSTELLIVWVGFWIVLINQADLFNNSLLYCILKYCLMLLLQQLSSSCIFQFSTDEIFPCSSCWPCRLCSHHPKWMMHEKWTNKWKVNVQSSNAALGRRNLDYFTIYSLFLCEMCFITLILSRWAILLIELHESSPLLWSHMIQGCHVFAFVTFLSFEVLTDHVLKE